MTYKLKRDNVVKIVGTEERKAALLAQGYKEVPDDDSKKQGGKKASAGDGKSDKTDKPNTPDPAKDKE